MKTIIKYIIFVFLVWSCNSKAPESIMVSVLADKTDTIIPKPELSHIKSFLDQPKFSKGTREFWYGSITNTDVNASYKTELSGLSLFDNNLKHQAEIKAFYSKIDAFLKAKNNTDKQYYNSSIIRPLVAHLNKIKQGSASSKIVLIYSDILEANDLLNVYTYKGQHLLINSPEKVLNRFKSNVMIPDLSGIKLYIIYYPKDLLDNRLFEQMLKVYYELFKDSGLEIQVGIDNSLNPKP